jgi:hypothetical protein
MTTTVLRQRPQLDATTKTLDRHLRRPERRGLAALRHQQHLQGRHQLQRRRRDHQPRATETIGDGTDQTCDGLETCYKDSDNDGYRPDSSSTVASSDSDCSDSGEALSSRPTGDCNDSSSSVNPGLPEICDAANTDEDCNGSADDADSGVASTGKTTYYLDADSDTYGVTGSTVSTCDPSGSYSATDGGDCDDAASSVNPGITSDTCWNGVDEDCDVAVDGAGGQ